MKIKNFLGLLLTVPMISSCSYILQGADSDILEDNKITPLSVTQETTCGIIQKNIILGESKKEQQAFDSFIKSISVKYKIRFIDKVVLWSLLQMNLRPDLSSPTAKMQLLLKLQGKEYFYNSYTENGKGYPYLYLLSELLKKHKSKYSLGRLALIIDKEFKSNLYVNKNLEIFLGKNKAALITNPNLKRTYIRGDETLRENERLPRLKTAFVIRKFNRTKKQYNYKLKNFLFSYNSNSSFVPKCNFDMGLYKDSIFLINKEKIKGHIFGLKSSENVFMAVSSQKISDFKTIGKTLLFEGSSNIRSSSLCSFKNRFNKKDTLWLFSSDSRDPGQHLYHLLSYGLDQMKSINELDEMLKFSRHLFLKDPVRLIIESRRSSPEQLNELLKLETPIYNSKKLGLIWGFFKSGKKSSFILDDRKPGSILCSSI